MYLLWKYLVATEAVNVAGKQRMFTQRMLKRLCDGRYGKYVSVKPDEDLKNMSIKTFDEHLQALGNIYKK